MLFWQRTDYLENYSRILNVQEISQKREHQASTLAVEHWQNLRETLKSLPIISKPQVKIVDGSICVGDESELNDSDKLRLKKAIELLIPWRKGPFNICGQYIDAEWRSDFKWERIVRHLGDMSGKKIVDVGCNNAYYMFRMLDFQPKFVLGLDPSERCFYSFELLQRFAQSAQLHYELFGVEHLNLYPEFFDVVLCLGVIYHRSDPVACLKLIRNALKPGGVAIIESQTIPGEDAIAFCPPGRYAKAPNVYFVPTNACLVAWAQKAGFIDVEVISQTEVTVEEQRQTKFAPYESLVDFLDPEDSSRTVEGHPAPLRVAIKVKKKL